MFLLIETMTREEKEAERDRLADFLARHRNTTREEILDGLFKPPKIGPRFRAAVSRSQMQLRIKGKNFEQGKIDGDICDDDRALRKGTCAYNRAASAYWHQCCVTSPGYEHVIAPGLFVRSKGWGWMDTDAARREMEYNTKDDKNAAY